MGCYKKDNGVAKVLLMKFIFCLLCAFIVITPVLSLAIESEKPEFFVQIWHNSVVVYN